MNKTGGGYALLYTFVRNGDDGSNPNGLIQGTDGLLYGTTASGSIDNPFGQYGFGTIFKLNKDGSGYTVLHSFSVSPGGLTEGSDGMLYGTTAYRGMGDDRPRPVTVFRLNKDGSGYTVLRGNIDGEFDRSTVLLEGSDGALYGTTRKGGNGFDSSGPGTVFKLNKDGSGYMVLRVFAYNDGDGARPEAHWIEGSDGSLSGATAFSGGTNDGGTVFKMNKDGSGYTVLRSFGGRDGVLPHALLEGGDGNIYGATSYGGINDAGTVFKLNKDGSGYTVLRHFSGSGDGSYPSGLVQGSDGSLYGTTYYGGDLNLGTVFRLFGSTPTIAVSHIELSGAGVRLSVSGGAASQTFRIQATPNLTRPSWQAIGTNQFGIDGKFQFLDTSASNYPTRFYRSATP